MTNAKMLGQSVRILALVALMSAVSTAASAAPTGAPTASQPRSSAHAAPASKLAGLLLPKRTRLIINYHATMLA